TESTRNAFSSHFSESFLTAWSSAGTRLTASIASRSSGCCQASEEMPGKRLRVPLPLAARAGFTSARLHLADTLPVADVRLRHPVGLPHAEGLHPARHLEPLLDELLLLLEVVAVREVVGLHRREHERPARL